jgi:hypothetical protein
VKKKKKTTKQRGGASVLCPRCKSPSHVLTTRRVADHRVARWRQCLKHDDHRFETEEST